MPLPVNLMYHSVDDRNGRSDTWNLSVSPDNFTHQVEALVSERTVVPLEELARCVRAGRVPRRWWDRLECIVMEADFLPPVLCISLLDRTLKIKLESIDRRQIFVAIWSRLRELDADDRDSAIAYLVGVLAVQPPADPHHR
jgi:hypothetical protein